MKIVLKVPIQVQADSSMMDNEAANNWQTMLVGQNCHQRSQQLHTHREKQQLRRHEDVLETLANQNQVLNGPKLYKLKENFK